MILIMDNYDSFTYNLYQLVGQIHNDLIVKRNDKITLDEIKELNPDGIIISPGPGNPRNHRDFGICHQIIKDLGNDIPILGVCLGHQGIFNAFGGEIIRTEPVHGKTSQIFHNGQDIFHGIKNPLFAARYHSLLCKYENIPECMEIIAKTREGMIMGIKHRQKPIIGLQFHPESVGTSEGSAILKNFLKLDVV
jgi:anthranilate synthase component II